MSVLTMWFIFCIRKNIIKIQMKAYESRANSTFQTYFKPNP